jgi:hypothetical protein
MGRRCASTSRSTTPCWPRRWKPEARERSEALAVQVVCNDRLRRGSGITVRRMPGLYYRHIQRRTRLRAAARRPRLRARARAFGLAGDMSRVPSPAGAEEGMGKKYFAVTCTSRSSSPRWMCSAEARRIRPAGVRNRRPCRVRHNRIHDFCSRKLQSHGCPDLRRHDGVGSVDQSPVRAAGIRQTLHSVPPDCALSSPAT